MKIFIDWGEIQQQDDYFLQLLPQLQAPKWHGRNLNALADSVVTGNINGVEPPFCIVNLNIEMIKDELRNFFLAVNEIYKEANLEGKKIRVFSE